MALLGSVLVDREIMAAVGEIVRADRLLRARPRDDLSARSSRSTSAASRSTRSRVAEELRGARLLDNVGGLSYINSLMDTVQTRRVGRILREDRAREGDLR